MTYRQFSKCEEASKYSADIRGMDYIPKSYLEYDIVYKVTSKFKKAFGDKAVLGMAFGLTTAGCIGSKGMPIKQYAERGTEQDVAIAYMLGAQLMYMYTDFENVPKNSELVYSYKVACGEKFNNNATVISNIRVFGPGVITTQSYTVLHCCGTEYEALAVGKYLKTRFMRFLTGCLCESMCTVSKYRLSLVPDQNFSSQSDIDWTQSIADIDKQLYKKYNLSDAEIAYIEKTIKPME